MSIRFLDPSHSRRDWIIEINACQPTALRSGGVRPGLNSSSELRGVRFGYGNGGAAGALLGHFSVPDVVQVGGDAVEGHSDFVAAEVDGFVMKGLVEVADELGVFVNL